MPKLEPLALHYISDESCPIPHPWLSRPSPEVAPDLVGCVLVRQWPEGKTIRSLIVETEAYAPGDPACHAYRRRTRRNAVMFGPAGMSYVYLIYGMYHCLNVVTDLDGQPSAVLLRAVELEAIPDGIPPEKMKQGDRLAAGPGKLCRALDITLEMTAKPLQPDYGLWLEHRSAKFQNAIDTAHLTLVQTTRIGISQGAEIPWRWYLNDSPAVSKR